MTRPNTQLEFKVTLARPPDASIQEVREYIVEALQSYCKSLRPAGSYDDNDPGDPMFELDPDSIKVVMRGIELKEADCRVGDRVKLHPATDRWMQGDRYGTIVDTWFNFYCVKLDKSGDSVKLHRALVEKL